MNQEITILTTVKAKLANAGEFLHHYFHEGNLGGMLVPGNTHVDLGQNVNVEIYFLEENRIFHFRGVTRWKRVKDEPTLPAGIGVEFAESERKARDILIDFARGRRLLVQKRVSRRIPAVIDVEYASDSIFLADVTDNVSTGGAFILTNDPPEPGTQLKLRLRPPGYRIGISINAEVVWQRTDERPGMGVRFVFPWYRSAKKLNRLVDEIRLRVGLGPFKR